MKYGKSSGQKELHHQIQSFQLTIYQFQFSNQIIQPFYLNIQSSTTTKSWESQTFQNKLSRSWSIVVDSPVVQLKVFAKINKNFQVVYCTKLNEGNETGHPIISKGKSQQILKLRYRLANKKILKSQQKQEIKRELVGFESYPKSQKQNQESFAEQSQRIIFERDSEYEEVSNITFKKGREQQSQKGFENIDDEQQAFEGYLDDSTSFIEDLISIIPSHQNTVIHSHNELEKVTQKNQSEEEYTTAEKWYINKFKKNKKSLGKQSQSQKNVMNSKLKQEMEQVIYTNTDYEKDQMLRQISDLNFSQQTFFKQLNFSIQSDDGLVAKICSLFRKDQQTSSSWNSYVNLPVNGTILIECLNLKCTASGCLGSDEIQSGLCLLYNQQGNETSKLSFKCKSVSNFNVQTHSMLKYNEISATKIMSEDGVKSSFVGKPMLKIFKGDESNIHGGLIEQQQVSQFSNQLFKTSNFLLNNSKDENIEYHDLGSVLEQEISTFRKHQKNKKRSEKQGDVYSDAETRKDCMGHKQLETNVSSAKLKSQKNKGDEKEDKNLRKRINKIKMKQYSEFMQQEHQSIKNKALTLDSEAGQVFQSISISSPLQFPKTAEVLKKQSVKINKLELESISDDKYNSLTGIDLATLAPHEDEKIKRIGEVDQFERERSSTIQAMQLSPRNFMYSNIYNFHQQLQHQKRKKRKLISFKLCSISVSLHRSNYNSKALKIYIDNNIYFTESSNHSHFLTWTSNGYFFLDVPKSSVLYIELFEDMKGLNNIVGSCKVHLHCLNLTEAKQMMIYDDFIRTENEESIGRVLFNYQLIERRGKSLNLKHFQKQMYFEKPRNQSKRNSRVSTSMNKKNNDGFEKSSPFLKRSRIDSKRMSENSLYFQEEIIERLKNQQPIARRKYTGGNILIAKANRFKHPGIIKYSNEPGPGSYDIGSSFDRHSQYYEK